MCSLLPSSRTCSLGSLAVLVILTAATAVHAQVAVAAGSVRDIAPAGMACLPNETVILPNPGLEIATGCDGARSTLLIDTRITVFPQSAFATAGLKRVLQFRVDEGSGVSTASWLPVHVAIPVRWLGRAFNDSLDPTDISAYVSVNSIARLTEGTPGNPSLAGRTIYEVPIQGLTHGGPNGCLSVPKGAVSAALTAVKCVLGAFMKEEGDSHIDLVTVVQAGRTYNIEVAMQGELFSSDTGPPVGGGILRAHPRLNFESGVTDDPFGLTIDGDIRVTAGTSVAAELQELRDLIDELRRDLETHTHEYLTGRGEGHNNVVTTTGAAVLRTSGASTAGSAPVAAPSPPQPAPAPARPTRTRRSTPVPDRAPVREPLRAPVGDIMRQPVRDPVAETLGESSKRTPAKPPGGGS